MSDVAQLQQAQQSHYKSKAICLAALSGYWYLATYNSDPTRFAVFDLFFSALLVIEVLFVQVCLLSLVKQRSVAVDFLAGLFFTCNLGTLYFAFALPLLWRIDWYAQVVVYALVWLVAKQFFSSFAIGEYWRKLVVGAACALFVFQAAVAVYFHEQLYLASQQYLSEEVADSDTMTLSPNVRKVEFTQTPNVYLMIFEALLPESLASELLGIPSLEYARTLEENGFLRFPNYFSDATHTRVTLARVFSLDPQHRYSHDSYINAGYERGPLREIFRSNGYQTHFYTNEPKFGFPTKGYYLDRYIVGSNVPFTACLHMDGKPAYALFGYCNLFEVLKLRRYVGKIERSLSEKEFVGYFLDDIKPFLEEGDPNLFVFYIKLTDHIHHRLPTPEQLASFIEEYKQGSKEAAVAMEEIVSFIRKNDPDSLQFIFADHGSLRFIPYHDDHEAVGRRLRILDNYGGMAAFYPPQACEGHIVSRQWYTTSMITRDILRCLAGGVDPFVNDVTYRYVEGGIDLTDYLYE